MARQADPDRQRRKRSLRVVSRKKVGRPRQGERRERRRPPSRRTTAAAVAILAGIVLLVVIWSRLAPFGGRGPRMARFSEAPAHVRADLLYLSYLDSLARDDRALPTRDDPTDPTVARTLARLAGLSARQIGAWGLLPEPEPDHLELTSVFRELGRRDRVVLPYHDAALWTHLHERRVHPGYLVFGRTRRSSPDEVDFCAVLTAINSIQPELSALIWREPDTGQLVHGSYDDLPQFDYYGGGRLGDDLAVVYREYFQTRDQRDQKPLFKGP